MIVKTVKVEEEIQLDESLGLAYETIKMSYEFFKEKEGLEYSFNEYLLRCGLTSLLSAFEREQKNSKVFEGHA